MLEHEQHILPVDLLFDDGQIGDFVKSIQIDSPYQQMLFEGVLTESVHEEKLYVSFTVEGYFHYVLGEVINNQTNGKGPESLKQIVDENKLNGAKEGVEQCLIRDVLQDDLSRLMWLIDEGGKVLDLCSIPLANAFLVVNGTSKKEETHRELYVNQVLAQLFNDITDNDISVLEKTIDYLESVQHNSLVQIIYIRINEKIKPNNINKALLYLNSIQYVHVDKREEQLNGILQIDYESSNLEQLSLFFQRIASQFYYNSKYDEALVYYKKCLDIELNSLGEDNLDVASSYNNIGLLWNKKGEYDKALEFYDKCFKIRLKVLGHDHTLVATSYNNIGYVLEDKGEYDKALEYYERCLKIYLKSLGSEHPYVATSYNNIGFVWNNKGDYDKALEFYNKCLVIKLKTLGSEHHEVATTYSNIGYVLEDKGDYDKALEYYNKCLKIDLKIFGEEHPDIAKSYNNIGLVFKNKGEYDKALGFYEKSLAIRLKTLSSEHPSVATSYNNIGVVWNKKKEYDKAIEYYNKSLEIEKKRLGNEHLKLAISYKNIGLAWKNKSEYDKALEYYEKCLKIKIKKLGDTHTELADLYFDIGYFNRKLNNLYLAIVNNKKGFSIQQQGGFLFNIAECYEELKQPNEALNYFIQSAEIRKEDWGVEDEVTQESISNAIRLAKELNKESELPEWMKK